MMTTQSYDCWATQAAFYSRQESFQSDDLGQFAHHSSEANWSFQSDDDSLGQFAHHSSEASHASQQEIDLVTDANHSKELWPWTNVIWLSKVHQFFFWHNFYLVKRVKFGVSRHFLENPSPLITPVQLDPTGGVVGINCLFVCCQVTIPPIPPTPVSGSCYLPLGALQLMWATCCKIQWQSWYICW